MKEASNHGLRIAWEAVPPGRKFPSSSHIDLTRPKDCGLKMADIETTSSVQEQLVACLQPYESVLGWRTFVTRNESCVWLHGSPTGNADADRQLMEALELVALLARADFPLWKQVTVTMYVAEPYRSSWERQSNERPAGVGVCVDGVSSWSDDLCDFLVASSKSTLSSSAFEASKKLMLSVISEREQTVEEVPVWIARDHADNMGVQLRKISQIVRRQRRFCQEAQQAADEEGASTLPFYCGLRFRAVDLAEIDEHTDASLLGYAAEIASCGVTLDSLRPPFTKVQEQYPHEFMSAMVQLFPLGNQLEMREVAGVACVRVREFSLLKAYQGILSAVAGSSCVRKVEFAPHFERMGMAVFPEHRRWLWSWLAYSAFLKLRGGGKHRIQAIWIHAQTLDQNAVDGITHILHAANPVASLFSHVGRDIAPQIVSASQFALLDPSSKSGRRLPKWSCGQCFDDLSVTERTEDWVSVLLPRWGQAWVDRDDILPSQSSVSISSEIRSIPHVTLFEIEESLRRSAVALLRMVGHGIRHLVLVSAFHRSGAAPFNRKAMAVEILNACPLLENLELRGDKMNLATTLHRILDAFASGSCRLQRLKLECGSLSGGCRSLPPLMDALTNARHPARYQLREITLARVQFASMLTPAVIASCVAMLQHNTVLQELTIHCRVQWHHRVQFADCVAQLQPFNNERIDGRRDPGTVLAFLSVVAAERGHNERVRTIQRLDAHVVALIFAFATPSFIRRVTIMET